MSDDKNRGLYLNTILQPLYLTIVALTVTGNIYLVSTGYLRWSIYLLIAVSIVMALLMIGIFRNQLHTNKIKQINDNVNESRQIIFDFQNKVLPFFKKRNSISLENNTLEKSLLSPLNWLLCIFVFLIFFKSGIYTKFNFNDPMNLISLILVSLLQLTLLSFAILGIIVVLYKKIKGVRR